MTKDQKFVLSIYPRAILVADPYEDRQKQIYIVNPRDGFEFMGKWCTTKRGAWKSAKSYINEMILAKLAI